ncbi:MAG: alpha/beta fold hydrolase [Pseudomonadota bacterium]
MTARLLVHGVPDSPAVWQPLIQALGADAAIEAPALPGFHGPLPQGFKPNKDSYADWLVAELERLHAAHGPVDVFGHDWGALIVLRAASLRPDLVASWTISNAMIDPEYTGHRVARAWATPLLGEAVMAITRRAGLAESLAQNGLPEDIAKAEAAAWNPTMRRCILGLYRSAVGLRFSGDWVSRLAELPGNGLVIWGETDPYVPLKFGRAFAERWGARLHVEAGAGHWAIAERPASIAAALIAHWGGAAPGAEVS